MGAIAHRVETLLGVAVVATAPVPGGDICTATRARLSDGGSVLIKTRPHAPADFFPTEARGLDWLRTADGAEVATVLAAEEDCLILRWVEPGRPTPEAAERFGRALARTHRSGAASFGAAADGYIGALPLPNRPAPTWPEFFATRRILPYLKLARDRAAITPEDGRAVEDVVRRITDLAGPDEPPARLHGDLWSGNVVWGHDGRAVLVDPAAYAGHRETDLAMLGLFGLSALPRMLGAYQDEWQLADGWQDRVPLHQLFPLLVHACAFAGGYGSRAGAAARAALRAP